MAQAEIKTNSTSFLQKMREEANAHFGWHLMFPDLSVVSQDAHSELAKYADTLGSLSRECRLIIARLLYDLVKFRIPLICIVDQP